MKKARQRNWGAEVVKDLLLFGPEKWSFLFVELTQTWSGEVTEFFGEDLFFRKSRNFSRKNCINLGEDLFYGNYLILTEKPP